MIIKITMAITINTNFLFLKNEVGLFLNEEDPHLEHTILPPKDRSETNDELPQLKQTLFTLIQINFNNSI
tara:strand:- start:92 stop:301 length:210 start_codon:yes stop_codon:yes gene_type:complete